TVEAGRVLVTPLAGPADEQGVVDSLLVSAAEAYEEAAVVVVLAGLESHGVTGVAATKRCGGFALAEVDGQPLEPAETAITAAGISDVRLPVEQMPREIAAYVEILAQSAPATGAAQA